MFASLIEKANEKVGKSASHKQVRVSEPLLNGRETKQFAPASPGIIQWKLLDGMVNDPLEREADCAAQAMGDADSPTSVATAPSVPNKQSQIASTAFARNVLQSPGQPLDAKARAYFEPRFRHDFSAVRVHADATAERSARDANAHAYTVGHHIVLGAGPLTSETLSGRRMLAHELTHVVQQSRGANFVQRLIRTPYPWKGLIVPAIGAHVRSSPDASGPANILRSVPRGQMVDVISASGSWLRVEIKEGGGVLAGYILHTLVDDAASSAMAASVGTTMVWKPSGPGSGTDFESWASAATEAPFPAVTATTVMNCWEAVLLSAYRARALSWTWIHSLYTATPAADWVATMSRVARHAFAVPGPNPLMPQRGDLVFFNGLAHVALATGNGSEVYTFWPPPNTPFTPGGTTDKVKVFTIESLVTWWTAHMPPAPKVEFGPPAW